MYVSKLKVNFYTMFNQTPSQTQPDSWVHSRVNLRSPWAKTLWFGFIWDILYNLLQFCKPAINHLLMIYVVIITENL